METKHRMFAALLLLNLAVWASKPAGAQVDGPVEPPKAVGIAATLNSLQGAVFRLWDDGTVDVKRYQWTTDPSQCVFMDECGPITFMPGTCPGDVNKSGDVGFDDVLGVIGTWGPCPEQGDGP